MPNEGLMSHSGVWRSHPEQFVSKQSRSHGALVIISTRSLELQWPSAARAKFAAAVVRIPVAPCQGLISG